MEKGFGQPVSAIGVNHFKGVLDNGEGEWDQVLLEGVTIFIHIHEPAHYPSYLDKSLPNPFKYLG